MKRALLILCLAFVLGGCEVDRSNLIPRQTSREIIKDINSTQKFVQAGECFEALKRTVRIRGKLGALPELDPVLRRTLSKGITRLQIAVQDQCEQS